MNYDAVLVISFGGPEAPEDVRPFLERVLRGRAVPQARLDEVAKNYERFGGVSPLPAQNRALVAALEEQLAQRGRPLPVFLGNRNWRPLLADTLRAMSVRGIQRALGFVTSAYGSYSGCRQYQENLVEARAAVGAEAPQVDLLPLFHDAPGFTAANGDQLRAALLELPAARRAEARIIFTAHSIPVAMAAASPYEDQLRGACEAAARAAGRAQWSLAFQSRSGPPQQPWLEPDIASALRVAATEGARDVVVAPIGFVSDHLEVVFDLDVQARQVAEELGLGFVRARTAGSHPGFVALIADQVEARFRGSAMPRNCASSCCPTPAHGGRS